MQGSCTWNLPMPSFRFSLSYHQPEWLSYRQLVENSTLHRSQLPPPNSRGAHTTLPRLNRRPWGRPATGPHSAADPRVPAPQHHREDSEVCSARRAPTEEEAEEKEATRQHQCPSAQPARAARGGHSRVGFVQEIPHLSASRASLPGLAPVLLLHCAPSAHHGGVKSLSH